MEERRTFPRLKLHCLIWYHKSNNGNTARVVMSKDISVAGTMFLAEEYIPYDTDLELKLKMPNVKNCINLNARVVRTQAATGILFYKTAVEFIPPSTRVSNLLSRNTQ